MNATDRADAPIEGSLVRAPSHQPGLEPTPSTLPPIAASSALESDNEKSIESPTIPLARSPSHHPHFEVPEGEPNEHALEDRPVVDIEHVPVDDDPRSWSNTKKNFVMGLMISSVMGPMIAPSIYNPVIDQVKSDLNGNDTQVGLTISLFILFQGVCPLIWASSAEIIGRKPIYLTSFVLYMIGSVVGSRATTMSVLVGMRCVQAMGSSAVLSVGAGSLADMYEVHERGSKLGLYYGMPMMGPALGPIIGGALGSAYGWRSTMYFLACFCAVEFGMFIFFPDTWRKERSRVYQKATQEAIKRAFKDEASKERKRQRKLSRGLDSTAATPPTTGPGTPWSTGAQTPARPGSMHDASEGTTQVDVEVDYENREVVVKRKKWMVWKRQKELDNEGHAKIKPSIRDVNPVPTMISIFQIPTNSIILVCSGLLFAAQYTIAYTGSLTFAEAPYNYDALKIGLVLLSFGIGNIAGSVLGGRYSDWMLRRLRAANGGIAVPEMRLKCTFVGMPFMIAGFLTYAWTANYKTNIAGPVVALFFSGTAITLVYSSTLAYLVDANPGRSSPAVSCNSFCRGVSACIMSQVSVPIRNAIGDGGLYSLFSGILLLSSCGLLFVATYGERWRASIDAKHKAKKDIESKAGSRTLTEKAPTPTK